MKESQDDVADKQLKHILFKFFLDEHSLLEHESHLFLKNSL